MRNLIDSEMKKLNRTFFLGCGRIMGQLTEDSSEEEPVYMVGSYANLVTLSSNEFDVYLQSIHARTMEEWGNFCIKRGLIDNFEELEYFEEKFRSEHILIHHQYFHLDDPILSVYSISKNGLSYGYKEEKQKWLINSQLPEEDFGIEKEEYDIWRSATEILTIREYIDQMATWKKCPIEEAFSICMDYLPYFHQTGLWTIEYCGDPHQNLTEQTGYDKFFNVTELNDETQILSAGEIFDDSGEEIIISAGDKKVPLQPYEYIIWTLCKIPNATITNINKAFEIDIDVLQSVITKLMKNRIILLWSGNESLASDCPISIVSHGKAIGIISNDIYAAKDFTTGEVQLISKPLYFIWVLGQKDVSLSMTMQALSEILEISLEEAEQQMKEGIPRLFQKGLISLQILKNEYIEG